jgi:hypothetical protein
MGLIPILQQHGMRDYKLSGLQLKVIRQPQDAPIKQYMLTRHFNKALQT